MAAFKLNLKIDQGATFDKVVTYKAGTPAVTVNLTGCTARMQARSELTSPIVLLELTTGNGGIVLGGVAGTVSLYMSEVTTAALIWSSAVYDLELTYANGSVRRLLSGSVSVSPEVTRG